MCGRFLLYHPLMELYERFYVDQLAFDLEVTPSYNIAPSQQLLAVVNDGKQNRMGFLKWGLVPYWAKDASLGHKLINARVETLASKPSFAEAYKKRRCIIIASGFYEWKKEGSKKTPMLIQLKNKEPIALAGLWERWVDADGKALTTATIITTEPNELMQDIHDRMPVILDAEQIELWLNREVQDTNQLDTLLRPFPADQMKAHPVSNAVNSPKNNDPSLIKAV
ncbi:SOS response-associated peptidase [Bacillus horti]|uniref:Abasic site processing protein n=1 Tax=Caldalkalibacillus horti TaxID=77523 RepID=A0ABT9W4P3_9BACI|nr:SOS response-associated peptidase [Bacillus horti]MDQ0168219.1 putative SOS response-associated peptidase YedK [Bacillus horti]